MCYLTYYVISDLHMGYGKLQDFVNNLDLISFLQEKKKGDVLIFNGDTFDFVQTPFSKEDQIPQLSVPDCPKIGPTEQQSLKKLKLIIEKHADIFQEFKNCFQRGVGLHFIIGNHDLDLAWPQVSEHLRKEIRGTASEGNNLTIVKEFVLYSPKGNIPIIKIFHGHQQTGRANYIERWEDPFIYNGNEKHLIQPWGTQLMAILINPIDLEFPYIDNIKPFSRFLTLFGMTNERYLQVIYKIIFDHFINVLRKPDSYLSANDLKHLCHIQEVLQHVHDFKLKRLSNQTNCWIQEVLRNPEERLVLGLVCGKGAKIIIDGIRGKESKLLQTHATKLIEEKQCNFVICGHTHESNIYNSHYINTGTWIPYLKPNIERNPTLPKKLACYRKKNLALFETNLTYAQFSYNPHQGFVNGGGPVLKTW